MATEWLDNLASDEPWFNYIHTMDPHAPYRPPEPYMSEFAPNDDLMPTLLGYRQQGQPGGSTDQDSTSIDPVCSLT